MGKAKPRVKASSADKPPTSRNRGKGKVPKANTDGVAADTDSDIVILLDRECDSVAAAAETCRQNVDSTVTAMKQLETRTTSVYTSNTPVKIPSKIPSPGDVALSQTQEPIFEVGWDCHSPCDEGSVNSCNVVEIMRTFAHEEQGTQAVHPSGTPPLLGLWIGSALEDDPSPAPHRLHNHRFKKSRSMRPTGIRRAADSRALFQRLATVLESHSDTPELSPRRSVRLIQQSHSKKSAESDSVLKTMVKNSESEKCHVRPATAQHTVCDPVVNSPRPQLNRSEEDLWTDEELFDNDSFIKATQELFAREGFFGPKSVRQQVKTSTPVAPCKVGRYTFSLEPPPLSGIASGSQFKHCTLVSSVEKVVKAVHKDAKVKVPTAAPKTLPFCSYRGKVARSSLTAVGAKTRLYEQCRKNTAPTSQALPDRASTGLHSLGPSTRIATRTVQPMLSNGQGLTKCHQSAAAQTFSKPARRPSGFMPSLSCVNQPSSVQSGRNFPGHHSIGNIKNRNNLNGRQPSKKQLPSGAWKPNSIQVSVVDTTPTVKNGLLSVMDELTSSAHDVNVTDMSLSDDLLAAVAEPDDLLDSQEYLLNGTQTCAISASGASTLILSSEHCITSPGECPKKCDVASKHATHLESKYQAENDSFMSDDDALSEPQLLAMLADLECLESTQASEGKPMASQEVHTNERKPCQQTNNNTEYSRTTPKPAGEVCNKMTQDIGGICASQASVDQLSSSGTQKRCSPEEIQRKKADAIRRRKIRLGLSGMKH